MEGTRFDLLKGLSRAEVTKRKKSEFKNTFGKTTAEKRGDEEEPNWFQTWPEKSGRKERFSSLIEERNCPQERKGIGPIVERGKRRMKTGQRNEKIVPGV